MTPPTPHQLYGALFVDVQMQRVFSDGKTFVDATPRTLTPDAICALYQQQKGATGFSLRAFVHAHFDAPQEPATGPASQGIHEHIVALWPQLLRHTPAASGPADTLLPLPHPYVVPGGRFRELYYWDTYFTMLGLVEDGFRGLAQDMVANFAALIDRYGFIPNANRSYMLTRSQPPLFFKMVAAVSEVGEAEAWCAYLPQLKREHAFWMRGEADLAAGESHEHLVRLADGSLLNRFWDSGSTPREESWRDDVLTAEASTRAPEQVWRELRAAAESGWDFSSRWCADPLDLASIETTAILPVDLNAMLWGLECAIASGCAQAGEAAESAQFAERAVKRKTAIHRLMWNAGQGHFVDYHWVNAAARPTLSAAALVPLYFGLATPAQAAASATTLRQKLLAKNGLLTTPLTTGQQWDAPNGWAPLQWMAIEGLSRYGEQALAGDIAARWLASVHRVYLETGRLLEKYDVTEDRPGGGGEYPTQDGFGWTNGTFVALRQRYGSSK